MMEMAGTGAILRPFCGWDSLHQSQCKFLSTGPIENSRRKTWGFYKIDTNVVWFWARNGFKHLAEDMAELRAKNL